MSLKIESIAVYNTLATHPAYMMDQRAAHQAVRVHNALTPRQLILDVLRNCSLSDFFYAYSDFDIWMRDIGSCMNGIKLRHDVRNFFQRRQDANRRCTLLDVVIHCVRAELCSKRDTLDELFEALPSLCGSVTVTQFIHTAQEHKNAIVTLDQCIDASELVLAEIPQGKGRFSYLEPMLSDMPIIQSRAAHELDKARPCCFVIVPRDELERRKARGGKTPRLIHYSPSPLPEDDDDDDDDEPEVIPQRKKRQRPPPPPKDKEEASSSSSVDPEGALAEWLHNHGFQHLPTPQDGSVARADPNDACVFVVKTTCGTSKGLNADRARRKHMDTSPALPNAPHDALVCVRCATAEDAQDFEAMLWQAENCLGGRSHKRIRDLCWWQFCKHNERASDCKWSPEDSKIIHLAAWRAAGSKAFRNSPWGPKSVADAQKRQRMLSSQERVATEGIRKLLKGSDAQMMQVASVYRK